MAVCRAVFAPSVRRYSSSSSLQDIVIVGAARTPMGGFRGSLSSMSAPQLGAVAISAALERAKCPVDAVDEVYMGAVLQGGMGQAPDRQAALFAGIPVSTPCTAVNKVHIINCQLYIISVNKTILSKRFIQVFKNKIQIFYLLNTQKIK